MLLQDEQTEVRTFVDRNLQKGTIAASYLLTGVRGIGKRAVAYYMAKRLNCQIVSLSEEYTLCSCPACHKIDCGNHPDITVLGEDLDDRSIKIETVRELQAWLRFKPFEGKYKVAIICEAERLTIEAQNALLKTLEEPPVQTVIILTAAQPLQLLPTILSRVTDVRLLPMSHARLAERLKLECSLGDEAYFIAYVCNGSLEQGKECAASDLLAERAQLLEALFARRFDAYIGQYEFKKHQTLQILVPRMIDILLSVCRDMLVMSGVAADGAACRESIVNRDMFSQLDEWRGDYTVGSLTTTVRELQTLKRAIKSNGNLKLILSHLMVTVNTLVG